MTTRVLFCAAALLLGSLANAALPVPDPPDIPAGGYMLLDYHTGKTLAERAPDSPLEPASLTKLMTAYVVFKALDDGRIKLDDQVLVSEKAWRTPGSRMFIREGTKVPVEQLIQGMIIVSGNDASVALAEYVAGTESAFADLMNHYAGLLGMKNTHFVNATGLPAEGHITTARDIATLTRALIREFPQYYKWYSVHSFKYNDIKQNNRNLLLYRDDSVDGLKTGFTDAAGYCLVSSAKRDNMRLISVVMKTDSPETRASASLSLLNYGFRFYETRRLYSARQPVTSARVWMGQTESADLGVADDLYVTIPRGSYDELDAVTDLPSEIVAPVEEGASVGELKVSLDGDLLVEKPLTALSGVPEGSFWQRAKDQVLLWLE